MDWQLGAHHPRLDTSPTKGISDLNEAWKESWPIPESHRQVSTLNRSQNPPDLDQNTPLGTWSASYKDSSMVVSCNLEFARSAAKAIIDNIRTLEHYVMELPGLYYFEGGYDIIPNLCRPRFQDQADFFEGTLIICSI